jgi:hypothetical protein
MNEGVFTEWNPSPEQLKTYKEREIAMCVATRRAHDATHMAPLKPSESLFSLRTWQLASGQLAYGSS